MLLYFETDLIHTKWVIFEFQEELVQFDWSNVTTFVSIVHSLHNLDKYPFLIQIKVFPLFRNLIFVEEYEAHEKVITFDAQCISELSSPEIDSIFVLKQLRKTNAVLIDSYVVCH